MRVVSARSARVPRFAPFLRVPHVARVAPLLALLWQSELFMKNPNYLHLSASLFCDMATRDVL